MRGSFTGMRRKTATVGDRLKFIFALVVGIAVYVAFILVLPVWLLSFLPIGAQIFACGGLFVFLLIQMNVLPAFHRRWATKVLEADGWTVCAFHEERAFRNYEKSWRGFCAKFTQFFYCGTLADGSGTIYEFSMLIRGSFFGWLQMLTTYDTRRMDDDPHGRGRKMSMSPYPGENMVVVENRGSKVFPGEIGAECVVIVIRAGSPVAPC